MPIDPSMDSSTWDSIRRISVTQILHTALTAILQNLVSLPAPKLTTWQGFSSCFESDSHLRTRSSIAVDRINVPMLISGGLGVCKCARGTKYLMYGSCRYCFWTADNLAAAASVSVRRMATSGSDVCGGSIILRATLLNLQMINC